MTTDLLEPRPPRRNADYRWTPEKALAFVEALAQHGKVAAAARAVGMTRQSAYRLKERMPQVAAAWLRARALGRARRAFRSPRRKATLRAARSDGPRGHGDAFGHQGDAFRPQVDGLPAFLP